MDLFIQQAAMDISMFYDANGEDVDIKTAGGDIIYAAVRVVFYFGGGEEYRGADAPGTDGRVRIMVSDAATMPAGYMIHRDNTERWRILGGGDLSEDGLEWLLQISRLTT